MYICTVLNELLLVDYSLFARGKANRQAWLDEEKSHNDANQAYIKLYSGNQQFPCTSLFTDLKFAQNEAKRILLWNTKVVWENCPTCTEFGANTHESMAYKGRRDLRNLSLPGVYHVVT